MPNTLEELKEKLLRLDEISLIELLRISADDIIDRFDDLIEDNYDRLTQEFEEEDSVFNGTEED